MRRQVESFAWFAAAFASGRNARINELDHQHAAIGGRGISSGPMNLSQLFDRGDVTALAAHLKQQPDDVSWATQKAAQGERLDLLQRVLSYHPSQFDLDVSLEYAAERRGRADFVRTLLDAGASPAAAGRHFPLWVAAQAGDVESLQVLLDAGADANARTDGDHDDPDGCRTPLLAAIRSGVAAAVAVLLDAGADVNVITPTVYRPLDIAEELGDATIIHHLRERGAAVLTPEELDIVQAARRGFMARVRKLLPTASPQARGAALVYAVGQEQLAIEILEHSEIEEHSHALIVAVQEKQVAVARAILEYGGIEKKELRLALAQCIAFDVPEVVPLLIAAGVDRDSPASYYHAPPIVDAAGRGRVSIVRDLLDAGVDLQAHDDDGQSALAAARDCGQTEVIQILQAAGATTRTPAAIAKATRQKLAASARRTWFPQLDGTAVTGSRSQFGGLPWLRSNEVWPACTDCETPLTFFVQVDLSRTPKAARDAFGAGLLQLFHCTTCNPYRPFSGGHQVRIVDRADVAGPTTAPKDVKVLPTRPITGWTRAVKDYPYREADESLLPEERAVVFGLNRQGDKLSGWPNWVQDPTYPRCPHGDHRMTQLILQIDSNHGVVHTWGDNGVGFILQCPHHHDQVTFLWDSA
ncbi:ankyrin repeat domain-containing protein [Streptomyces sp. NPDC008343]|uniref:ankyrin repeat domain-containing protein n=1 Tax=Streptomyces sp. NPDC008343 TaxID=3364828 RepID=UPI0036EA4006